MKRILLMIATCTIVLTGLVLAEDPKSLDEAKQLSIQSGKPLLIEFYREDCEFCAKAAEEARSDTSMIAALQSVIHITLCVQYGEGMDLSADYKVGNTFPVFILANNKGEVIARWTGFGGASRFVRTLNSSFADLTSINERRARFEKNPNFQDALKLAEYYSDIREYMDAISFYSAAEQLNQRGKIDYTYQIFTNTANAVWNGDWPFDSIIAAADDVLEKRRSPNNISNCTKILGRVARKTNNTDKLGKYLNAALIATDNSKIKNLQEAHLEFSIDTILYITGDTSAALRAKETSLGTNWENDPKLYYPYTAWCLERKINLTRAEFYARAAADRAGSGALKAQVLHTLASILDAEGKYKEAVRFMEMAVSEDPANSWYSAELERITDDWSRSESRK